MHPSPEVTSQLTRITALLNEGKLSQAESACRTLLATLPNHSAATHLLGLIRVRAGDSQEGERLIRHSVELEPRDHKLRVNPANHLRRSGRLPEAEAEYRHVLRLDPAERSARHSLALTLSDRGRLAEAEVECRALIDTDAGDAEAWSALGFVLDKQNRLPDSEAAYRQAVQINPAYGLACHNLGSVLARMDRAEESLAALERAQSLGAAGFELAFNRGKTLTLLYRLEEAERAFAEAVSLRPRHCDAQLNLARLRYMRGDPDFARAISAVVAAHPDDVQTQGLREIGRLQEAETEAMEAAGALPGDSGVIENLVSILLSRGRPGDAMPFIRAQRARAPLAQAWIAYEATAARLLGEPRYQELFDYDRFVRSYVLEPPAGWSSIAELNAALVEALGKRHRFSTHPIDQSLRHGSQTTRNLVADPDPAAQAILRAFEEPLRSYLHELGHDADHPFLARNRGSAVINTGWSVQLQRGGFHVNHYHNQGWVSSAYYVAVPDEVRDTALQSGWLKFGEPRFPTPQANAASYIRPSAGLLVLFPSYLWHGTNAIHGPQVRTTIAFDALPSRAD